MGKGGKNMNRYDIKRDVIAIFDKANHQQDALLDIYRLFIPNFDDIKKIENWPSCGQRMWKWICDQFVDFDAVHHPNVVKGGIWINNGFSCDRKLDDWKLDLKSCTFIMKDVKS